MSKITMIDNEPVFYCPGCGYDHIVHVSKKNESGAQWTWNGSKTEPTFSPSINVFPRDDKNRCHSFVREGKIQYLNDCFHELKGQTIDLPDYPDDDGWWYCACLKRLPDSYEGVVRDRTCYCSQECADEAARDHAMEVGQ